MENIDKDYCRFVATVWVERQKLGQYHWYDLVAGLTEDEKLEVLRIQDELGGCFIYEALGS